jgi:hypothetical protein
VEKSRALTAGDHSDFHTIYVLTRQGIHLHFYTFPTANSNSNFTKSSKIDEFPFPGVNDTFNKEEDTRTETKEEAESCF